MRITPNVCAIFQTVRRSRKGWPAPEIAQRLGVPRQNIDYTLRKMTMNGVLHKEGTPSRYRVRTESPHAQEIIRHIRSAKEA